MHDTTERLTRALLTLVSAGGNANRLVLEGGSGFVVVRGEDGQPQVEVEAAGGRHLPDGVAIDIERVGRLDALGLRQRTAASTYRGQWSITGDAAARAAAEKLAFMMRSIYDHPGPPRIRQRLDDRPTLDNPVLVAAMKRLGTERSMRARITLYNRLLAARLVVLLDAPLDDPRRQDEAKLRVVEQLAGTDVVAAFTDDAAHRLYDPRERPYTIWTGRELFPLLAARKIGSLLINPGSGIRGELYRNEILTISDGVRRQAGTH